MPEIIDLAHVDDPRDVVHRAVAGLVQGGIVALGTDAGYAALVPATDQAAVDRVVRWLDAATGGPGPFARTATLLLRGPDELRDWTTLNAGFAVRLVRRAWPGPVIFRVVPNPDGLFPRLPELVRELVRREGRVAVQSPSNRMLREILRLAPGPLVQLGGHRPGATPGSSPSLGRADWDGCDQVTIVVDSGPTSPGPPPTEVALDEAGWTLARPGVVPEVQVERWAAVIILFVCTGNTCRSPMAEALCKAAIARRLGCPVEGLVARGYHVASAGVAAGDGMPAAGNAVAVVRGRGGSLEDHQSQQLSADLVRDADHILAMTWDHLDAVLDQAPEAGHRIRLLDPAGGDIPDPVGLDFEVYQETAREIERHLEHLLAELGI